MPRTNQDFNRSKKAKDDEYYTLYHDVQEEVGLYLDQLRGKRILCPCDWMTSYEPEVMYDGETGYEKPIENTATTSQFVRYLLAKAAECGIRSVTASGYNSMTGEGVKFQDIDYSQYDVIITNPPFSLFGEFVDTLMENGKEFLIIGSLMDASLASIVRYVQEGRISLGYHYHLSGFMRPDGTVLSKQESTPRCCQWYTNMHVNLRQRPKVLIEDYEDTPEKYPHYINFDAIEVESLKLIPDNYWGMMGVPVSFLQIYNAEQFEIIGESNDLAQKFRDESGKLCSGRFYTRKPDGTLKRHQPRYIIRRRQNG